MKALVLAGGRGGNMAPFSGTRPNPMVPVGGEYLIDHTLRMLMDAGVNTINMVVGHESHIMRSHLSAGHPLADALHFVDQGKPDGIGRAVLKAEERFSPGEHFILVYADTLTATNIFSVTLQSFALHNEPTAAICLTKSGEQYGNVYLDQEMRISKIVEKPKPQAGLGNYVLAGVFVLPTSFFGLLRQAKGSMENALKAIIKKETLRAAIWEDNWLDLAYPWDILTANRMIMDRWKNARVHESVELQETSIKGAVRISEGVEIRAGAVLEGPAYIGPGSFIGHNVLVRPYTSIGANGVVGHGAELKNCVLFPGVTLGRLTFIGDSVVGENVDIGAGCMAINRTIDNSNVAVKVNGKRVDSRLSKLGAFIGDGAAIGASNILAAGSVVKSGHMIQHNCSFPKSR